MNYFMKFYDNNDVEILETSTLTFLGDTLNISELKQRFNLNFVQNKNVKCCKVTFLGKGINKSFIAGFRNESLVIVDMDTKKEYSSKEFSTELNNLEQYFNTSKQVACLH